MGVPTPCTKTYFWSCIYVCSPRMANGSSHLTWKCLRAVLHYEVIAWSEVRGGSALVEAGPKLSRDRQCVGFETHLDTLSYPSGGN